MNDYDREKYTSYLLYFDVNSLYTTCMLECLTIGDYKFPEPEAYHHTDWEIVDTETETGYILEADLSYPPHLHKAHASFPLAPMHDNISINEFSHYHKTLLEHFGLPLNKPSGKKLFCTLKERDNYVVHFKTLKKLYLRLGLKLEQVHRVPRFKQGPWLKPFIELNLRNRKLATDACSKERYKLMSNCVFGRFCTNKRKHKTVHLVTQRTKLLKNAAKTMHKYSQKMSRR